jgi:hypothetical protein
MTAAKKTDAAEPPKAESGFRPKRAEGVPSFILQFGAPEEIRTLARLRGLGQKRRRGVC